MHTVSRSGETTYEPASLMTLTETPIRSRSGLPRLSHGDVHQISYALEGNISVSAQAAAWMAELMGLPNVAAMTESAAKAKGDDKVYLPALAGLAGHIGKTAPAQR